ILSHRLVRDLIAYLRLIDQPSDAIACARVLAMPAWGLTPSDLVLLTERATKSKSLWETVESSRNAPAFVGDDRHVRELVHMVAMLRQEARRLNVAELFLKLAEVLDITRDVSTEDRKYFDQFVKFVREWEPKSETRFLREFVEYLDFFEQAGGSI